jgi:hypothetical protein
LCLTLIVCVTGASALAQDQITQAQVNLDRFERQLEQFQQDNRLDIDRSVPAGQRMLVEYGGTLTFSFMALDDADQNTHILRQPTLTLYGHVNLDGAHDFLLRIRSSYRDFNTGDDFDGRGDDWIEPTLDRGVYRFDLRHAVLASGGERMDGNLIVEAGRQLVQWGNGLSLSRDLDGLVVTGEYKRLTLRGLAGRTRNSSNDFDSSRPHFDTDTRRNIFGGSLSVNLGKHRPYIYGITQIDDNRDDPLVAFFEGLPPGIVTRFHYETFYIGGGSKGSLTDRLTYSLEVVYEGGEGLSNSFTPTTPPVQMGQTLEDVEAWAMDLQLNFVPGDANRSLFSFEVLLASGDDDRGTTTNTFNGNAPGTNDNAYNGFGYINTGMAFGPNASNLLMFRLGASTYPLVNSRLFQRMQVGADVFVLNKFDADAPIDESTGAERYLGTEADLFVNWQVLSDVILTLRYGVFFPGDAILTDKDERHFVYTGVTYAF